MPGRKKATMGMNNKEFRNLNMAKPATLFSAKAARKRATRMTTAPLASMPCEQSQLVLAGRLFMRAVCRLTAAAGFSSSG